MDNSALDNDGLSPPMVLSDDPRTWFYQHRLGQPLPRIEALNLLDDSDHTFFVNVHQLPAAIRVLFDDLAGVSWVAIIDCTASRQMRFCGQTIIKMDCAFYFAGEFD